MAQKDVRASVVRLDKIQPDPNQPRKNFNPERLAALMSSIKRYGIMTPIDVEDIGGGKYQIVDGERRYRAAVELGLSTVPVIIEDQMDDTERVIKQFHLQEQHEGWSATEKAVAVEKLAEQLGVEVKALATMLSIPTRTVNDYVAFAQLLDRSHFVKNEIPVHYAGDIVRLRAFVKKVFMNQLEKEFTHDQEKQLEAGIIHRIKTGGIRYSRDIAKIRDSVRSEPKAILAFMKDQDATVDDLFLKTEAKGAYAYRNFLAASTGVLSYGPQVLKLGAEKYLSQEDRKHLQRAKEMIVTLIG